MSEQIEGVLRESSPERYIRINITKNSKGYGHETTVSLRWSGDLDVVEELKLLNRRADEEARAEIEQRQQIDARNEAGL